MTRKCLLAACCLVFSAAAVRAEALDEVKKKLHDKVAGYKTMSFKMKMTMDVNMMGMSTKSENEGSVEYMKKDGKILSRYELKSKGVQKYAENETKTDSTMLSICDGQFIHIYSETNGQKSVTKQTYDPKTTPSPFDQLAAFKVLEEHSVLKLLPDEAIDGKSCYAIEALPKDEAMKAMSGRTVSYYDKATGLKVKGVSYDKDGKPNTTTLTTDIKIDAEIKAERFVFKAPEGVKIEDMTKTTKADDED